jgi:hypothetical protein
MKEHQHIARAAERTVLRTTVKFPCSDASPDYEQHTRLRIITVTDLSPDMIHLWNASALPRERREHACGLCATTAIAYQDAVVHLFK